MHDPRRAQTSALVIYEVTTLWFETGAGDGFREPGFSKGGDADDGRPHMNCHMKFNIVESALAAGVNTGSRSCSTCSVMVSPDG